MNDNMDPAPPAAATAGIKHTSASRKPFVSGSEIMDVLEVSAGHLWEASRTPETLPGTGSLPGGFLALGGIKGQFLTIPLHIKG